MQRTIELRLKLWRAVSGEEFGAGNMANQPQEESSEYQSRRQKARATGRTQVTKRDGLILNSREALYSVWNGANLGRASGIQ